MHSGLMQSADGEEKMLELPQADRPARGRRRPFPLAVDALIGLGLIAVVVAAFLIPRAGSGASAAEDPAPDLSTVRVTAGDMVSETKVPGAVAYAKTGEIAAGRGGVLTEVPAPGAPLSPGAVLYRLDTRPVVLLSGALPAWRDFNSDMSDGGDVLQLEQNLSALGFFTEAPDAEFDWDTAVAIREWQRSLGLDRTGVVERSDIVFWDGPLRVDTVDGKLGQDVGPGTLVYRVTSPELVVDLAMKSSDRSLAIAGERVTISLPDGTTTEGVIRSVGAPLSRPTADGTGKEIVIPVRVGVADQAAVAELALASVTVGFASALRNDVLTVPVDALVPLDETHYAVEVPPRDGAEKGGAEKRELMPVTVGAVTAGKVEISGKGIVEGLVVVVPAR